MSTSATQRAIQASSTGAGAAIYGSNTGSGPGVHGTSSVAAAGVEGDNTGTGASSANGVFGKAAGTQAGVTGTNTNTAAGSGNGVHGDASGGGASGVIGIALTNATYGVQGQASTGSSAVGVLGISTTGNGFQGYTTAAPPAAGAQATNTAVGGTGLVGFSNAATGTGIGSYGATNSPAGYGIYGLAPAGGSGYAGLFNGNALVTGNFSVLGVKNALVRDHSGSLRRMYSTESPESWFEDFGNGKLHSGVAVVDFPTDLAPLVKTDNYHVFLTARGDSNGLYVNDQSAGGFTVKEAAGGSSDVAFSWRIVAKRGDVAAPRLEHVEDPPVPILPEMPDVAHILALIEACTQDGRSRS
jgi:hypothetical protein